MQNLRVTVSELCRGSRGRGTLRTRGEYWEEPGCSWGFGTLALRIPQRPWAALGSSQLGDHWGLLQPR